MNKHKNTKGKAIITILMVMVMLTVGVYLTTQKQRLINNPVIEDQTEIQVDTITKDGDGERNLTYQEIISQNKATVIVSVIATVVITFLIWEGWFVAGGMFALVQLATTIKIGELEIGHAVLLVAATLLAAILGHNGDYISPRSRKSVWGRKLWKTN